MIYFDLLLQCYKSGQMSECQWEQHKLDADFAEYLLNIGVKQ